MAWTPESGRKPGNLESMADETIPAHMIGVAVASWRRDPPVRHRLPFGDTGDKRALRRKEG